MNSFTVLRAGPTDDDHQQIGIVDRRDCDEVFHQRERLFGHERFVDRMRIRHQEQRVAVGRGFRDRVGADDGARAGTVVHDERLGPRFLQVAAPRKRA